MMEHQGGECPYKMRRPADAMRHYLVLLVLWNVKKKPASGYELAKNLKADGMHIITPARLYPLLKIAKLHGWIEGKKKKVGRREAIEYTITRDGIACLRLMRDKFFTGTTRELFRYLASGNGAGGKQE